MPLVILCVALGAATNSASASDDLEERVQAALEAHRKDDEPSLAALAAHDDPDAWILVEALRHEGEQAAAEAVARVAPEGIRKPLMEYVRGRKPPEAPAIALFAEARGASKAKNDARVIVIGEKVQDAVHGVGWIQLREWVAAALARTKRGKEAARAYREAADAAWDLGWTARATRDLIESADAAREARDYNTALQARAHLLAIQARLGDVEGRAKNLIQIGFIQRRRKDHDASIVAFGAARKDYEKLNEPGEATAMLAGIAYSHRLAKRGKEALATYEEVRAQYTKLKLWKKLSVTWRNTGYTHEDMRDFEAAKAAYEAYLAIAKEHGDGESMGWALWCLANNALSRKDRVSGIEYFERAARVFRESGLASRAAEALRKRGNVCRRMQRTEDEIDAFERARALYEEAGDQAKAADRLRAIGHARYRQGRHKDAIEAYERALRLHRTLKDRAGEAWRLRNIGQSHMEQGAHERALALFTEAVPIFEELDRPVDLARCFERQGDAHAALHDHDAAIASYERARSLLAAQGLRKEAAWRLRDIADVHEERNAWEDALWAYEQALGILRAEGDLSGVARMLDEIGGIYAIRHEPDRALPYLEEALAIHEAQDDRGKQADVLGTLGLAHQFAGRSRKAIDCFEKSLELSEKDSTDAARARIALGGLYGNLGNYAKALEQYDEAVRIMALLGDAQDRALAHQGRGQGYALTGRLTAAAGEYETAMALLGDEGSKPLWAVIASRLALVYYHSGRQAEAATLLERALKVARKTGLPKVLAVVLSSRGAMGVTQKSYSDAVRELTEAHSIQERAGDDSGASESGLLLGYVEYERGNAAAAKRLWTAALKQAQRVGLGWNQAFAHGALAKIALDEGQADEALSMALHAERALRPTLGGHADEVATSLREQIVGIYDFGVRAAVAAQSVEYIGYFLEAGRAGALLESLRIRDSLLERAVPGALLEQEASARAEEARVLAQLRRARAARTDALVKELTASLEAARANVKEAVGAIQRHAKAKDLVYPEPADLNQIRASLRPDEALVVYALLDTLSGALVVERGGTRWVALPDRDAIRTATQALIAEGDTRTRGMRVKHTPLDERWTKAAGDLRRMLIGPLKLASSVKRVVLSPHDALAGVPFCLLLGGRELTYIASGTTLMVLAEDASLRGAGVLAFGDPSRTEDGPAKSRWIRGDAWPPPPLPGARQEAKAVGTNVVLGEKATEARLRSELKSAKRWRSVHLACHGLIDPERPLFSSLALATAPPDDGLLTVLEVFRMDVPADLVVLSACESGRGRVSNGEGIVGLTRAFMFAGAPRVLCSLWKVDDEATKVLMLEFYRLWNPQGAAGLSTAAALMRAQEHVRRQEKWAHPYYWAAWTLWGRPE